jgi:hypothetical protein
MKQSTCLPGILKRGIDTGRSRGPEIAASMKAKDDHDGHRIWNDVAERIDLLRQEGWRLAADVAPLAMIGPCVPQALWS